MAKAYARKLGDMALEELEKGLSREREDLDVRSKRTWVVQGKLLSLMRERSSID